MKTKIFKLEATAEISEVCCDLSDAYLNVCASDDKQLKVVFPDAKNVSVAVGDNQLIINQSKQLFALCKQRITVYVPTHVLPDLKILGKRTLITLSDGIFGDLSANILCGKLNVTNCSFASAEVLCGDTDAHISDSTVKGNLFLQIEKGELLAENSFVLRADCNLKNGNMGLINLSGNDFSFESAKGNITLTIVGTEDEYNSTIRIKCGTSNRESTQNEGAQKSVKAFTEKGNVMLDFVGERVEITEAAAADNEVTENEDNNDGAEECVGEKEI